MARTRAVPRRRPNINFQQRGNIDFERQRVAATRNISSPSSSASSSSASSSSANRRGARSPLGNLARNLARDIGRNPVRSPPASRPASPIVRPRRRIRRRISSESSTASSSASSLRENLAPARSPAIRRRRIRASDVKIKFVLPQVKDVEVKYRGNVVRKMKVRRVAKHTAKKRNVRYG